MRISKRGEDFSFSLLFLKILHKFTYERVYRYRQKKGTRPRLNENKPGLTISSFPTGYTIFSEVFLTFAKFWVRPRSESIQIDTALLFVSQCNKFNSNITNQQIWMHQRIRLFLQQQGFA